MTPIANPEIIKRINPPPTGAGLPGCAIKGIKDRKENKNKKYIFNFGCINK